MPLPLRYFCLSSDKSGLVLGVLEVLDGVGTPFLNSTLLVDDDGWETPLFTFFKNAEFKDSLRMAKLVPDGT